MDFYKYILSKQCEKNDNIVDLRLLEFMGNMSSGCTDLSQAIFAGF